MDAIRRKSVLGVALLLAAATAVADTVVTIDSVVACSVESANADSIRIRLARPSRGPRPARHTFKTPGQSRTLSTADIYEVRLSDPSRVSELAALLPRTRVTTDSGQPIPSPETRVLAIADRWAEAATDDAAGHAGRIDTLARNASPAAMAAKCREMTAVLRDCGLSNDTVFDLFQEVDQELEALRTIRPQMVRQYVHCVLPAGLLGASVGSAISMATDPCDPNPVAPVAGCIGGTLIGAFIGAQESATLVARHRGHVNDLIRKVNRAVAASP